MNRLILSLLKMLLVATVCFSISGCGGEDEAGSAPSVTDPDTTPDPDPDPVVPEDPIGETPIDGDPDDSGFWLDVKPDGFVAFIDQRDTYDSDCFIAADDGATQLDCVIDIVEQDFYMNPVEIQYNAPPGLCHHVRIRPAWHWNYPSGRGPTEVTVTEDASGTDPVALTCTAENTQLGGPENCSTHPEMSDETDVAGPSCAYDFTDSDGPNCCFGDYTFNFTADSDSNGVPDTVEDPVEKNWGGSVGSCISPVSSSWDFFSSYGVPVGQVQYIPLNEQDFPVGLNDSLELCANVGCATVGTSIWANFYETTGTPHNHSGFYSATTTDEPYFVNPIDDLDGNIYADSKLFGFGDTSTVMPAGRPNWEFDCMDEGGEVMHRLRLQIREWNTIFAFATYIATDGATYTPDTGGAAGGVEGTDCASDTVFGEVCNDFWDFGDFLENAGGAYPTVPTVDEVNRNSYFPRWSFD